MKTKTATLLMLIASLLSGAPPENNVKVHPFDAWGAIRINRKTTIDEKIALYIGWLNGIAGNEPLAPLIACIGEIPMAQAIAMIDKFYKDHPEKWSEHLSYGILDALTVPGGPCNK